MASGKDWFWLFTPGSELTKGSDGGWSISSPLGKDQGRYDFSAAPSYPALGPIDLTPDSSPGASIFPSLENAVGMTGDATASGSDAPSLTDAIGHSQNVEGETGTFLDTIGNYFTRGVIIILGFIFVAVGLSMFKSGGTVADAARRIVPGA